MDFSGTNTIHEGAEDKTGQASVNKRDLARLNPILSQFHCFLEFLPERQLLQVQLIDFL